LYIASYRGHVGIVSLLLNAMLLQNGGKQLLSD